MPEFVSSFSVCPSHLCAQRVSDSKPALILEMDTGANSVLESSDILSDRREMSVLLEACLCWGGLGGG